MRLSGCCVRRKSLAFYEHRPARTKYEYKILERNEMGITYSTTEGDDKCYPKNMKSPS
jgi:hypothetical protein